MYVHTRVCTISQHWLRGLDTNFSLLGSYIYANIREQQQQGKSKKGHPLYVST